LTAIQKFKKFLGWRSAPKPHITLNDEYYAQLTPFRLPLILTVLMMLIETALLTPPVGLNLFTVKGIVDEPLGFIIRSVLPFVLILLSGVILVFVFPQIALWLPARMH